MQTSACLPSGEPSVVAELPNAMWQPSMSQNKTVLGYERQAKEEVPTTKSTAHTQPQDPDLNTWRSSATYRKRVCTGSSPCPTPLQWPQKSTDEEVKLSAFPFAPCRHWWRYHKSLSLLPFLPGAAQLPRIPRPRCRTSVPTCLLLCTLTSRFLLWSILPFSSVNREDLTPHLPELLSSSRLRVTFAAMAPGLSGTLAGHDGSNLYLPHLAGRGRKTAMNLRPARAAEWAPGQSGLEWDLPKIKNPHCQFLPPFW